MENWTPELEKRRNELIEGNTRFELSPEQHRELMRIEAKLDRFLTDRWELHIKPKQV
jgi:hypothetical protein